MRAGRTIGTIRRGLAGAAAAVVICAAGLALGTAAPASAVAPNMVFHSYVTNVPYAYTGPFAQVIFDRDLDGGTVTWFADDVALPECTSTVTPGDPTYGCWSRRQLDPGTYTIRVEYSGSPTFENTSTPGGTLTVHALSTEIAGVGPTTVTSGAPTEVSATLTGDETGATGAVAGAALTFTLAGQSCNGTTNASGVATCTLTAPTAPATLEVTYAGDARHRNASAQQAVTLTIIPTSMVLTAAPSSGPWGDSTLLTATLSPAPSGTVEFRQAETVIGGCGAVAISGGAAQCSTTFAAGSQSVTATFAGNATHAGSSQTATINGLAHATTTGLDPDVEFTVGVPTLVIASAADNTTGTPIDGQAITVALGAASCMLVTGVAGHGECAITPTTAGGATLSAVSIGTASYGSSSASHVVTVAKAPTTVTLSSTPTPFEAPASITATVAGADGGTVDFRVGADAIAGCAARPVSLTAGSWRATCATTALAAGFHSVSADYSGTANALASGGGPHTTEITRAPTELSYFGDGAPHVDSPVLAIARLRSTVTDEGLEGHTVSFSWPSGSCSAATDEDGDASCSLPAASHAGPATISFAFAGSESYEATSASQSVTVGRALTVTTLSVPATVVFGETAELTAEVLSGDGVGTVEFSVDGSPIAGCEAVPLATVLGSDEATCTTAALPAGVVTIEAAYSGNDDYEESTGSETLTVASAPTSLAYTGDTTGTIDAPVTVRAVLARSGAVPGPLLGHLVVFEGAAGSCTAATDAAGTAECTITPHEVADSGPITISFEGTAEYEPAGATAVLTVGRIPTDTALVAPFNADFGETVTLSATVTPTDGDGTVEFRAGPSGSPGAATVIAGCDAAPLVLDGGEWTAECKTTSLPAGALAISATYSGGDRHLPSTTSEAISIDPAWTEVVYSGATAGAVAASITLSGTLTAQPGGPPFGSFFPWLSYPMAVPLAVGPATPVPGMTLTFTRGDLSCAAVTDASGTASCSVTPTDVGQSGAVQVSFAGTAQFAAAQRTAALTIEPAPTTATLAVPAVAGFSLPIDLVATISPAPSAGTVAFAEGGVAVAGCEAVPVGTGGTARCTTTAPDVGPHAFTAAFAGTSSYLASTSAPQTLEVVVTTTALTYLGPDTATAGTPLEVSARLGTSVSSVATATSLATPTGAATAFASTGGLGIAGQALTFALGETSCQGVTDADGIARCTLVPALSGPATITVTFSGDAGFAPSTEQVPLSVASVPVPPPGSTPDAPGTPTLPATGSDPTGPVLLGAVLLLVGLGAFRLRRRAL